ncbi:MAG: class I SAM-dependent methyltransferase [Oscillatoria princeps RMCB-10]|jgi:predicted TPR repeat methyltransferase|nr:class I SAM-dependent methyltransferase [Oscillatoria princeps RMCB-10]
MNHRKYYNNYFFNRFLPNDKNITILDIGCGYGSVLASLQSLGYSNFTGVDSSSEAIKVLKESGLGKSVIQSELIEFLEKAVKQKLTWDVVLAIDILEHFSKDEFVHILNLLKTIISSTGILIIKIPNAQSPLFAGTTVFGDFTHEIYLTPASLTQVLNACGFNSVENHEATPVPYTYISFFRFLLWKIIRFFYCFMHAIETGFFDSKIIWSRSFYAVARKSNV